MIKYDESFSKNFNMKFFSEVSTSMEKSLVLWTTVLLELKALKKWLKEHMRFMDRM